MADSVAPERNRVNAEAGQRENDGPAPDSSHQRCSRRRTITAIAAREPASAISRAMVMEGSGQRWCAQVGILGPQQPVGHFHP